MNYISLYVDYQFDSRILTIPNFPGSQAPFYIGTAHGLAYGQRSFKGQLDEVRMWNKALTQEEIQANMYKEIQPQEGLVGYWKFNEGSGNIAYDFSGNENNGTLVNSPAWTADTPF